MLNYSNFKKILTATEHLLDVLQDNSRFSAVSHKTLKTLKMWKSEVFLLVT